MLLLRRSQRFSSGWHPLGSQGDDCHCFRSCTFYVNLWREWKGLIFLCISCSLKPSLAFLWKIPRVGGEQMLNRQRSHLLQVDATIIPISQTRNWNWERSSNVPSISLLVSGESWGVNWGGLTLRDVFVCTVLNRVAIANTFLTLNGALESV